MNKSVSLDEFVYIAGGAVPYCSINDRPLIEQTIKELRESYCRDGYDVPEFDQESMVELIRRKIFETVVPSVVDGPIPSCPWCDSSKIMAEGDGKRMAMVCQNCLARGPEVNVEEGRSAAIRAWKRRHSTINETQL